jgi:hypothetical protein
MYDFSRSLFQPCHKSFSDDGGAAEAVPFQGSKRRFTSFSATSSAAP